MDTTPRSRDGSLHVTGERFNTVSHIVGLCFALVRAGLLIPVQRRRRPLEDRRAERLRHLAHPAVRDQRAAPRSGPRPSRERRAPHSRRRLGVLPHRRHDHPAGTRALPQHLRLDGPRRGVGGRRDRHRAPLGLAPAAEVRDQHALHRPGLADRPAGRRGLLAAPGRAGTCSCTSTSCRRSAPSREEATQPSGRIRGCRPDQRRRTGQRSPRVDLPGRREPYPAEVAPTGGDPDRDAGETGRGRRADEVAARAARRDAPQQRGRIPYVENQTGVVVRQVCGGRAPIVADLEHEVGDEHQRGASRVRHGSRRTPRGCPCRPS